MKTTEIISRIWQRPESMQLKGKLGDDVNQIQTLRVSGLSGSLVGFEVLGSVCDGRVQVVVLKDREAASYFYSDCYNILTQLGIVGQNTQVLLFPTAHKSSILNKRQEPAGLVQRTAVLSAINALMQDGLQDQQQSDNADYYQNLMQLVDDCFSPKSNNAKAAKSNSYKQTPRSLIIATYPEALAETVVESRSLAELSFELSVGQKVSQDFVEQMLNEYGFERVDFVAEPGQYSMRGGIVDLFSYSDSKPYRVDFFGDTIDSIRAFAVLSQLSNNKLERVKVIANLRDHGSSDSRISLIEYVNNSVGNQSSSRSNRAICWWENPGYALSRVDQVRAKKLTELSDPSQIDHHVSSSNRLIADSETWNWVMQSSFDQRPATDNMEMGAAPQPTFNKKFELLVENIELNAQNGITTYILTENLAQIERLENIFDSIQHHKTGWGHVLLNLSGGFVWPSAGVALYTDHQIFDRYMRYKVHNEIDRSDSLTMQELSSLKVGDYVVHVDHGVGRFGGLVRSVEGGVQKEFIKLMYKDNDVLFVSLQSLHRVSKYKDKEAAPPKINKLGSGAWQKLKATTKAKVKDIARELIELYARRKASQGFAFSPDSYLQTELEASFLYEDTPDQSTATQAIKTDMESLVPMDRLVCGDVGFGKTEIAIRAAFKAVTDGKQVAVLVPTTILSLQHFRTFSKRLKEFPVRIENFSRVKSAKESKLILNDLAQGKVDILIGTHKLLGKDVKFHDLGLLIVDEEQKFGVSNKEKLRALKSNVDTLTLTATPIPRTLQFSLMGARDLSIINTPPPNRQPVATEVLEYDEAVIQEAILTEVERGGQVYFLHNRVDNIEQVAGMIERLCPKVRCIVGHGQMSGADIEKVLMEFVYGNYDVLVATTIIESGIDIPNANTMIINNAQNFGLSDLHQLRGRVGRTNRKAYCYLLIPSFEALTSDGARRLRAIEEFSDLGSGFNIAMQDLDIRGAGNILGAEQSGFISDIGYQTYQQIMNEAVNELREERGLETDTDTMDCVVETDRTAFFPDSYIGSTSEKIRLYRQLDQIKTREQLDEFRTMLVDRFGEPPAEAHELFEIILLRRAAQCAWFDKVTLTKRVATLYFAPPPQSAFYNGDEFKRILNIILSESNRYSLKDTGNKLSVRVVRIIQIQDLIGVLNNFANAKCV